MKQILQSLKSGAIDVALCPRPTTAAGRLLVSTSRTLVSSGTERMLLAFGKANWLAKAQQQPDKVRMVLEKIRTDGLSATVQSVQSKLDEPISLGYCHVGHVIDVGQGVEGFAVGDRVATNGKHAEVVSVPKHLCARIPERVTDDQAAFTVLAAIGLQGIRLVNPTLGECVVVMGLGVIGLITVQLLRAHGCRVLAIDPDPTRVRLAEEFGATTVDVAGGEDPIAAAKPFSRGRGVDAVLITASTQSNEPVSQAAKMCRQRGRIVLVGVTGLQLSRADFYEKELSFQVSCSYGPGRYDSAYEDGGHDYPIGFVRWTEQRNFEAVLDLMAAGKLDVEPLISHRFDLDHAGDAYDLLASDQPSLGIVLTYASAAESPPRALTDTTVSLAPSPSVAPARASVAFLGAGNYAGGVLIPAFKAAGASLHTIVSAGGVTAVHHGWKHGFALASTDAIGVLSASVVDTVVVATRHQAHAVQVLAALRSGKHVFCEKPLCLTLDELRQIEIEARARGAQVLMVGFNRRFAPHIQRISALLRGVSGPKSFVMTVNASSVPPSHWSQDLQVGGGRVIGEACHFIDLLRYLACAPIESWSRQMMAANTSDTLSIQLRFADGSIGTVHYFANGSKSFPKERLEVFAGGRILQLDNFRKLKGYGWTGFRKMNLWRQDKGQKACVAAFVKAIESGSGAPIPLDELIEVSRVTIEVANGTNC